MKRQIFTLWMLMLVMVVMAVPAKRGLWRMLKLADGTEVRAQLAGDEHVHFWVAEDGTKYAQAGDELFAPIDEATIAKRAMSRRSTKKLSSRLMSPRKVTMGERTHYVGKKKGIVILAQFTDVKFKTANNLAKYKRIMNEEGYSEGSFKGSVSDYFKAQSAGQFELDFDVVGPYTMKKNQKYYGQNDSQGEDMHPDEMIMEACQQADAEVDFKDYDWDGDGEVDQVFVLYAGQGEADGGSTNTIWPHMYTLGECDKELSLDGVKIDTYACSNEVTPNGAIEGIGCFCHEFSHCMGFPDFYDISYSGWFGMGDFDLMCGGSYNGGSFIPCGYTAHEKMMCGWQEPIVLAANDTIVENLQPMSNHGETFIIYNDAHPDEYFMLENRQKTGWDAGYPAKGLMVTHVDFDKDIWQLNIPNTQVDKSSEYYTYYHYPLNDHQRMTIVHADNDDDSKYWSSYGYYTRETTANDLYPYGKRDSLTAKSTPAPTLYNKNSKGTKTVEWAILDIKQNNDGTMSFKYRAQSNQAGEGGNNDDDPVVKPTDDYLFYESFDQCAGKGGNDGLWSGTIAIATFLPDHEGWSSAGDKNFGADKCAKFGTTSVDAVVTSPTFTINGEATLTFKAAAWNAAVDGTSLLVEAKDATMSPNEFELKKGEWTECTATITGKGTIKLLFSKGKRLFLDEVKVVDTSVSTVIKYITDKQETARIYTLDGRFAGTDKSALRSGIYVMNGKKFVK